MRKGKELIKIKTPFYTIKAATEVLQRNMKNNQILASKRDPSHQAVRNL